MEMSMSVFAAADFPTRISLVGECTPSQPTTKMAVVVEESEKWTIALSSEGAMEMAVWL